MNGATYYDTCVFLSHENPATPEHLHCRAVLETSRIAWPVVLSDVSLMDAPISELLDQFEIQCALYCVSARRVSLREVETEQRQHLNFRRRLKLLGLKSKDCKHLFAAAIGGATWLLTTDRDFWDPQSKRTSRFPASGPVKLAIAEYFGISVELPSRACATFQIDVEGARPVVPV